MVTVIPTAPQAPEFVKHLESKEIVEGLTVRLECQVVALPEAVITWYQVRRV